MVNIQRGMVVYKLIVSPVEKREIKLLTGKPTKQIVRNRATRLRNKEKMLEYWIQHPCMDCGIANPLVLTFDYIKRQVRSDIARMVNSSLPWATILAEIEKCVVRYFNCHICESVVENE